MSELVWEKKFCCSDEEKGESREIFMFMLIYVSANPFPSRAEKTYINVQKLFTPPFSRTRDHLYDLIKSR